MSARIPRPKFLAEYFAARKALHAESVHPAGDGLIRVVIGSDALIVDPYSYFGDAAVRQELLEYIEKEARAIPLSTRIRIEFELGEDVSSSVESIAELVGKDLRERIQGLRETMRRLMRRSLVLMVVGILIFAVETIMPQWSESGAIHEMLIIMCWVFIWKAVESFFFERRSAMLERMRLVHLYMAEYGEVQGTVSVAGPVRRQAPEL